jgi:malonyl-CoA O-methyltransferase
VVQHTLSECLSRVRRFGELPDEQFAEAVRDLPDVLRQMADRLECPPADVGRGREPPGWSGYNSWAESYDDEDWNPVVNGEEEVIWDMIGPPGGLRVLDVGCGTCRHAIPLAADGARVVALEPSAGMLARARSKAREARLELDLRRGAITDITAELGQFDLVLCCLVLSHVDDLEGAVTRLADRLTPAGRLIVSDFHPFCLLIGWRTSFSRDEQKYVVPNFLHLPSDYFAALRGAGLDVTAFAEPGRMDRYPGMPLTIVIEARKTGPHE